MGFRFRKRIRILPGISLNLSKSGVSASIGKPGATLNIGAKGTRATVGLPGTGISYSQKLDGENPSDSGTHGESANDGAYLGSIVFVILAILLMVYLIAA
jgi:hypothetical protein